MKLISFLNHHSGGFNLLRLVQRTQPRSILVAASSRCVVGLAAFLLGACSKEVPPPPPIAVEQTPAKLEEAFKAKQADPEVKNLMADAVAALSSKDYAKALFALQTLLARSDLTPQQRDTASRSLLAANKALEEQANSGDKRAQEALQFRRATK